MQESVARQEESNFLTTKNRFFEDAARVSIQFDIEEPVGLFTGRNRELENLHEILENPGEAFISQTALVTGNADVGKTQLARKYISEYSKEYDNNIIWINAANYATTTESFMTIAGEKLGIITSDENGKRRETQIVVQEVYDYFARIHRKSLFVFDNSERYNALGNTGEGIDKFLPSGPDKPYVLITSRDQEWGSIKTLTLGVFTEDEAAEFIKKALTDIVVVEESEVNNLAAELQYLPLTLTQAVAYIKMENLELSGSDNNAFTVGNYLELFEANTRDILSSGGSNEIFDRYPGTVMTTWQITIEKIKQITIPGEVALDILNIMSYLAPDKIPVDEIFSTLINDRELRHSALELLGKYCMVNLRGGKVNAHRVVQQATRIKLEEQGKTHEMVQKTFTMLKQSFPYRKKDLNDISKKKLLLPHLEVFLYHIHRLITEKLMDAPIEEMNIYLHLITWVVDGYLDLGNAQRRKELLEAALPSFEDHYGPNHPKFAAFLGNLGNSYGDLGYHEKQKELLEQALKIWVGHHGPNHLDVAVVSENLGNVHGVLGNRLKQKELLERALEIFKGHYGPYHLKVAVLSENLGKFHGVLGDHLKQKELLERELEIFKNVYGLNHSNVAKKLVQLGNSYGALGDHREKKERLKEALKIFKDLNGPHLKEIAEVLVQLGNVHGTLGDHREKVKLLEEALEIFKRLYGTHDAKVAVVLGNLGNAHGDLGDHYKKMKLLEEAVKMFLDVCGPDHLQVAVMLGNLGNAYGALGYSIKQKKVLEEAAKIKRNAPARFEPTAALLDLSRGKASWDYYKTRRGFVLL